MKKKISFFAIVLAAIMAMSVFPASADGDSVEIKFSVGDETLLINGNQVTVEKPYVVGEGVTLVPLRVITEAFGSTVEWEGDTKTITITYPDVNIVLRIDNPIAEINGKAQTLLSAPELTPNGFTMVPLRFISENFGAVVSYDEETKQITVIKDSRSEVSTVFGVIENAYIGDSYYNWSMENPKDMIMSYRAFDGTYTEFEDKTQNMIYVQVASLNEKYDFDDDFEDTKSSLKGMTLVKADKDKSNPKKMTMHFEAKDAKTYISIYYFITDEIIYDVIGYFSTENTDLKDEGLRIMSTFANSYSQSDIYDLSNIKDGVRLFESDYLKTSLEIPQDFYMVSSEDLQTSFIFESLSGDKIIHYNVFSKSNVGGAKEYAEKDYSSNKTTINEKIANFSSVKSAVYAGIDTYEYSYEITLNGKTDYTKDVFFEIGDYVYNIAVCVNQPTDDKDSYINKILNSIKAEKLDPDVVGSIIRNDTEKQGTFLSETLANCNLIIPKSYFEQLSSQGEVVFADLSRNILFAAQVFADDTYQGMDVKRALKNLEEQREKMEKNSIVERTHDERIGTRNFLVMISKSTIDGTVFYSEHYAIIHRGSMYIFMAQYPELNYSEAARNEIKEVLKSAVFK